MIVFQNYGVLDVNAIKTMGVSVKSEDAIGFFGTGLKFAIATLLRNDQRITIFCGEERFDFATQETAIMGRNFKIVCINNQPMGFTTELGKTWEMWMAFRELYCNCKDEGGEISFTPNGTWQLGCEGKTTIYVSGSEFEKEYYDRSRNFLEGDPIFSNGEVAIYDKPSPYIFYKGVRVHSLPEGSKLTYNLLGRQDLTEDRTLKSWWAGDGPIARAIMQMTDEGAIYKAICAPTPSYEREHLQYNGHVDWSPEFERVALREYKANSLNTNPSIRGFVKKCAPGGVHEPATLTKVQQVQLTRALSFCEKIGYSAEEYPIVVVETLGPTVMAEALIMEKRIMVSKQCFDQGTKYLASTLIEEVIHLREGLMDETRSMQTYLFNKIISMGEEIQGEPL